MEEDEANELFSSTEHLDSHLMEQLVLHDSTTSSDPDSDHGSGSDATQLAEVALEKLEYYCIALDDMIETGRKFVDARNQLVSLKEIRRHLSFNSSMGTSGGINHSSDRYAAIEDHVPDELKCPVCFGVFDDEVFQCINGHSTCNRCCETLSECPECRTSYNAGKIRNRTVEKLMKSLKIDCIYSDAGCREKLICAEMQIHVETCGFMNKPVRSVEYKEVRKQIKSKDGDTRRLEKRLEESNKRLMEAKAAWKSAHWELRSSDSRLNCGPVKAVEDSVQEFCIKARENEMTSLYETLNALVNR